jgi:hypothetical protein
VAKDVKACPTRQINQRKEKSYHDEMRPLGVLAAFICWHLDFIGELSITLRGNRWILLTIDYATNWPIAHAVPVALVNPWQISFIMTCDSF